MGAWREAGTERSDRRAFHLFINRKIVKSLQKWVIWAVWYSFDFQFAVLLCITFSHWSYTTNHKEFSGTFGGRGTAYSLMHLGSNELSHETQIHLSFAELSGTPNHLLNAPCLTTGIHCHLNWKVPEHNLGPCVRDMEKVIDDLNSFQGPGSHSWVVLKKMNWSENNILSPYPLLADCCNIKQ